MSRQELIKEFKQRSNALNDEYKKFKELPKDQKEAAKQKCINDLAEAWVSISQAISELDEFETAIAPDKCYEAERAFVTRTYKEFLAALLSDYIQVHSGIGSGNEDDEPYRNSQQGHHQQHNDEQMVRIFVTKQENRADTIKKALIDVINKSETNQLNAAYCRIKSKSISELWQRMQIADEEYELDRNYLSQQYVNDLETLGIEIENTLLILQEELEVRNGQNGHQNDALKLQRITIPKFAGDYFKWVTFRDLFTSMVVDNKSMSNAQRMQILKTNLVTDSEAELLVKDLAVSDANFNSAWGRLIQRYDNNRVVVSKYITKLANQNIAAYESKAVRKLLDTTDQILLALKNLKRPVEHWDDWIIFNISQKLSEEARKDWEKEIGNSAELPTWHNLKEFLEKEFRMLEGVENTKKSKSQDKRSTEKQIVKSYLGAIETIKCQACNGDHTLYNCARFKKMEVQERWDMAKNKKLCFICLQDHKRGKCEKQKPCKKCDGKHSTWLHPTVAVGTVAEVTSACAIIEHHDKQVLLATAVVSVADAYGRKIHLRALVDGGSQGSMITKRAASILRLNEWLNTRQSVSGVGDSPAGPSAAKMMTLTVTSRFNNNAEVIVDCFIFKTITKPLPDSNLCTENWNNIRNLDLADPKFNKTGPIDLLLGMGVVSDIMRTGIILGTKGVPMAQETIFGWIISGKVDPSYQQNKVKCLISTINQEKCELNKFWELEEFNPKRELTLDERKCEEFYQATHKRDKNGSFIVKLPLKDGNLGPERLGQSRGQAMARYLFLEKRLMKDAELREEYTKVMNEYIALGHAVDVTQLPDSSKLYYIPHHAVVKPDSLTTKTRVVFDASAKTSTGSSLNECMFTGAKQQNDLLEILIKWRKYKIVFKADIAKMYRMIKLDKDDQRYHTIFWRSNLEEPIKEYQLTTATFGTAAAPFMATRTLVQLAEDEKVKHPLAEQAIKEDFYVDDLISGSETLESALLIKDDLIKALSSGGMNLPIELTEKSLQTFEEDDSTKALGLQWNPKTDTFNFKINVHPNGGQVTKRSLFSEASKVFDPLGWLAPVVINPKLMMQELWNSKVGWDDEVPAHLKEKWNQFSMELPLLGEIKIDRWLQYEKTDEIELHGFCDASEKAYAAVVYTRVKKGDQVKIRLLVSKTRVAPIKTKLTLPRLELCGSILLSNLLVTAKDTLKLGDITTMAWSDSMITLGWLQGSPNKWNTFVANRVSEVQNTKINDWRHVSSEDNPADCASRGIMPGELKKFKLWWNGPEWLQQDKSMWPKTEEIIEVQDERRKVVVNTARIERTELLLEASSWFKMIRILAYVLRMKNKRSERSGPLLTVEELNYAKTVIYRKCQRECFHEEIEQLEKNEPLSNKSKLLQLNPFVDADGILRVGGRLQNAIISYENKHPIILPSGHQITKMIVHQIHLDTLHGGPHMMMGLLRKKYWIIQGKRMANDEFKRCVNCRRMNGRTNIPMMGNLPKDRVTLERSFLHTGIDYAGPIEIRTSRIRNAKIQKSYIAIFVCFGTRAIHLELVSDLTTEAFMAALHRFIARRGLCERIYSDNGSNFVGAKNQLDLQERQWLHEKNQEMASLIVNKGIAWKFIPPGSPNFGGIWERGVRSVKDHLKRTLKNSRLTFEEYNTILCQIESCLNSRPLCPLTENVENLNALTPGHFLIGESLMAPPQPSLLDIRANQVNRWKHLQLLQQHFWNRWNNEYLSQLQNRYKWQTGEINIHKGDLVLVKDEQLPPRHWLMGRILDIYPGKDGMTRVVSLRTHKGEIKRPASKICPLMSKQELMPNTDEQLSQPLEDNDQADAIDEKEVLPPEKTVYTKVETYEEDHEVEKHDLGPDVKEYKLDEPIETKKVTQVVGHKYGLRPRPSKLTMMAILGVILLLLGGSSAQTMFNITKFQNNAGIYFEDLGTATIIRTEWHMFIRFNLTRYMEDFDQAERIQMSLTNVCTETGSVSAKGQCEDLVGIPGHKIAKINDLNELLTTHGNKEVMRKRRAAPLNVVGWVQNEIFGVMAAEQAEQIENQFKEVQLNSKHLLKLIKNQTSIVDSTMNLMKVSLEENTQNFIKIKNAINALKNEQTYVKRRLKVMTISILAVEFVNRLEKTQNELLDIITDLHQGHISSQLFTPTQFIQQLEIIKNNLPSNSVIPRLGRNDLKSLYKMIKGSTRVTKQSIVVDIILPLVSSMEFQVLHVISIPTEYKGEQITLVPDTEYMMVTLKRDNFYQMSENEFHTCMQPQPRMFICSLRHPLYGRQSEKGRCERELLNHSTKISPACKFNVTAKKDFWISLHKKNSWIFGIEDKVTMNMICAETTQIIELSGIGMLEIAPGCEVSQPSMTLIAESFKGSNGDLNVYPSLSLIESVNKSNTQDTQFINLTVSHTDEIKAIQHRINTLKEQSHFYSTRQTVHYGLFWSAIIIILAILVFWKRQWLLKLCYKCNSTARSSENNGGVDVESGDVGQGTKIHQTKNTISSVDNLDDGEYSTVKRHRGGECPFRT